MADAEARIGIDVDVSNALAGLRLLQKELARFNLEMAKGTASQRAQANNFQRDLVNNINASGKFAASIKTVATTSESFTNALERNKLSMGQYFKYSAASSKTFSKVFTNEFNTIEKVARERVKTLQTQYIKLGRDANGAMKAIAVRPLALDMDNLATKTAIAAQKQAILNQLLRQGSTNLLNFGKNTQWAGRQLMVGFTIPLTIFGSVAAKSFMQMEEQAIKFKRVYGDTFTASAETDKMIEQVKELASEFTKYGVQVEKTMAMAADAAAMGQMGADLLAQINQSTKLAVLGGVEQEKALETTISLTNAFGIAAEDLAGKIDFLNAVENQTVTAIEDLTVAIPKAAPVIKQLGGTVEDLAFFLTAMKEGGINASEGANALKSGLASLINPAQKTKDMLSGLGINIDAIVEGNAGNVKNLVIEFAQALDTLDPLNRARAIEQLFGKFQFSRISTLFQNVVAEGTQAQRVLQLTASSAAELRVLTQRELKRVEDSPMFKFQKSIEDLKVSLAPLGEAFIKAVTPLVKFATELLNNFNKLDDGTKGVIVTLGGLLGVVGPVALMTFGLLANGVANLIKLFVSMGGIFNKSKLGVQNLATSTQYLTQEQLEADAVAASLNSKHIALTNTFSSETIAINNLVGAYNRALAAQGRLLGTSSARGRLTGPAGAAAPGLKLSRGTESVPGPRGAGDIVPAMLSPGEAVIPAKQSEKYGSIISAIMNDTVPGFRFGRLGAAKKVKSTFGKGIVPKNSDWSFAEGLLRTLTGSRGVYGPTGTAYESRFIERSLRRPGNQVAVRMYSDDMVSALGRGDKRYKNVFETGGKSRGSLDEAGGQRAIAEERLLKLGPGTDPKNRPAYGYVFNRDLSGNNYGKVSLADRLFRGGRSDPNERKMSARDFANQTMSLMNDKTYRYGDIAMVLRRRALRGRTTITQGDSLNSSLDKYAVPARFGTRSRKALRAAETSGKGGKQFIEAQILGGFSFKDIKRIVATEPQTIIALQTALKTAGIRGIRVGMPKMTMMQKIRSALNIGPKYPTKMPRIQSEGPYAGMYHDDPLILNGRTYYNKGVVSVPGPKGAGDIVPAMLSPGEAVIPAKFAKRYSSLINAMVSGTIPGYERGKKLKFASSNTLEAAHLAPESEVRSAAQTRKALQREIDKAIRMGLISRSDVDQKSISQIKGREKYRLFAQQMGLLPGDVNQAYSAKDSKGMSASAIAARLRTSQGLTGAGTESSLRFLQGTSMGDKYKGVTDATMKKYLLDIDRNMQKNLKALGDKQLTERQLFKVYRDSRIAAEKSIKDLSQRSAIKLANRFNELKLSPGVPAGAGGSGRTMKNFPIKGSEGSRNAQTRTIQARPRLFGLLGKQDSFLPKGSVDLSSEQQRNNLRSLLNRLPADGRLAAERAIASVGDNEKALSKIEKDIAKGAYGKLAPVSARQGRAAKQAPKPPAATKRPATSTTTKKTEKTTKPATKPRPVSNIISRENLGNGATRTVSQNAAGKILTTYFVNGKKTNESTALRTAQMNDPKASSSKISPRGAVGAIGGAAMTGGMMMAFSGNEQAAGMGQGIMMAGMAATILSSLPPQMSIALAAIAAVGGGIYVLVDRLNKARQAAIQTANAMSMTSEKLTAISEFTGRVSATDIRKEINASLLTSEGSASRQFGQTFIESELGTQLMNDIKTQMANGVGTGNSAENIGLQLAQAVAQGVLSVDESRSIAAAIGAQLDDYGFALKVSATLTSILGPNGEKLEKEPLVVALQIQQEGMNEFTRMTRQELDNPFDFGPVTENMNESVENWTTAISAAAAAAGAALAPFTAGLSAVAGGVVILGAQTFKWLDASNRVAEGNTMLQGLMVAKGAQQLALQQQQVDWLRQEYDTRVATKEEELALAEASAESATSEGEKATALENVKSLQIEINNLKKEEENAVKEAATAGLRNFYQIADAMNRMKEEGDLGSILDSAVESTFEGDELLIASAKKTLDDIAKMEDGNFKIALQLGLVSGEIPASVIERLIGLGESGSTVPVNFELLMSEKGLADVVLISTLLDNAKVNDSVFESIFQSFIGSGESYDDMVSALSVLSGIEGRYGVRPDLNTDGQEALDELTDTIIALEDMPDRMTKEMFADFQKVDPQLYDAIIADWDRIVGADGSITRELIIDAQALGDWDAVQTYLIATGRMGEAVSAWKGKRNNIVADRVTSPGNFIDSTTRAYEDEAAVYFLPTARPSADGGSGEETVTETGQRNTMLDGLLSRLKQVRDATISATGGIAELKRILSGTKTLKDFLGFNQKVSSQGFGPEFVEFINTLDEADRNNFLKISADGIVSVTEAGEALNKAFAEATLGDFQFSLAQGISSMRDSFTAMNRLTAAGLSNAEAYEIASDAALAYAIAIATTDEELQEIINKFRILKELTNQFDMSTVDGMLSATGQAFSAIQQAFDNKKMLVDLDFQMGTNESGYNKVMYSIDKIQEDMAKSEMKIFDWEYELDNLDYLLDGISEQEDEINETYDKRIDALQKVNDLNKDNLDLEKARLNVAEAVTSGDIAAAARAIQEYREKEAAKRLEDQTAALEASRKAALGTVTATDGRTRDQIEERILDLKKLIAKEEEDVLEPLEKQLTYAERARDVAISMVENEDYLGKNEKEWRAIEAAVKDTATQTDEWKKKIIDVFSLIPGFKKLLDEEGNIIGFEFDPTMFKSWIDSIFNGIRDALQSGVDEATAAVDTALGDNNAPAAPNNNDTGGGVFEDPPITVDDLNSRIPTGHNIAEATAAELEAQPIIITVEDLNARVPKGKGIAEATEAEAKPKPKPKPKPTGPGSSVGGGGGGGFRFLATGGKVLGPGTGTSDSIPALLSNGEYVVKASSVRNLGVDFLDFLNKTGQLPGFAMGGLIIPDRPTAGSKTTSSKKTNNSTKTTTSSVNTNSLMGVIAASYPKEYAKYIESTKPTLQQARLADNKLVSAITTPKQPTIQEILAADKRAANNTVLYKQGGFQGFEAGFQGLMSDIGKNSIVQAIGEAYAADTKGGKLFRAAVGTLSVPVEMMGSFANSFVTAAGQVSQGDILGAAITGIAAPFKMAPEAVASAFSGVLDASKQSDSMFEKAAQSAIENNFFGARNNPEMAALARIIGGGLNVLADPLTYAGGAGLATGSVKATKGLVKAFSNAGEFPNLSLAERIAPFNRGLRNEQAGIAQVTQARLAVTKKDLISSGHISGAADANSFDEFVRALVMSDKYSVGPIIGDSGLVASRKIVSNLNELSPSDINMMWRQHSRRSGMSSSNEVDLFTLQTDNRRTRIQASNPITDFLYTRGLIDTPRSVSNVANAIGQGVYLGRDIGLTPQLGFMPKVVMGGGKKAEEAWVPGIAGSTDEVPAISLNSIRGNPDRISRRRVVGPTSTFIGKDQTQAFLHENRHIFDNLRARTGDLQLPVDPSARNAVMEALATINDSAISGGTIRTYFPYQGPPESVFAFNPKGLFEDYISASGTRRHQFTPQWFETYAKTIREQGRLFGDRLPHTDEQLLYVDKMAKFLRDNDIDPYRDWATPELTLEKISSGLKGMDQAEPMVAQAIKNVEKLLSSVRSSGGRGRSGRQSNSPSATGISQSMPPELPTRQEWMELQRQQGQGARAGREDRLRDPGRSVFLENIQEEIRGYSVQARLDLLKETKLGVNNKLENSTGSVYTGRAAELFAQLQKLRALKEAGLTFKISDSDLGGKVVDAMQGNQGAGYLSLNKLDEAAKGAEISMVHVYDDFRRMGVATALLTEARLRGLKPLHSQALSHQGKLFKQSTGGRSINPKIGLTERSQAAAFVQDKNYLANQGRLRAQIIAAARLNPEAYPNIDLSNLDKLKYVPVDKYLKDGWDWGDDVPVGATGGLVDTRRNMIVKNPKYLNGGGEIFKPLGADTVPAMLTPGEFVMNKYAVQNHGIEKMKAMNSGSYSGESVYNYSINLNVKSDANPDEIARTVMTQIKRVDSQRLRSNRF